MPFTPSQLHYAFDLADSVSAALAVPVELTDAHLRTLATSSVGGSAAVAPHPFRGVGAPTGPVDITEPLVIAAVPQLGLSSIHVVPLRLREQTHAILWLTDVRGDLSEYDVAYAHTVALATIRALVDATVSDQAELAEASANAVLAIGSPEDAVAAIESAIQRGGFSHSESFAAVTIAAVPRNNHYLTIEDLTRHLVTAGDRVARSYAPGRSLVAQHASECTVLVAAFPREDEQALVERLLSRARDVMYRSAQTQLYDSWILGTSITHGPVTEAPTAIRQARQAAALGLRFGWRDQTVEWSSMRQFSGLAALREDELHTHFVPQRLQDFLADPQYADLVSTLRVFLDRAGNIQTVAAELFVHRASVYHRLKRIEEILGVDLSDGHDRLETHLGMLSWTLLREGDLAGRARSTVPIAAWRPTLRVMRTDPPEVL